MFVKLKKEVSKFLLGESGSITKKSVIISGLLLATLSATAKEAKGANCFWHDSARTHAVTMPELEPVPVEEGWDITEDASCDSHCSVSNHLSEGGGNDCNKDHFSGHKNAAQWQNTGESHRNSLQLNRTGTSLTASHTHEMRPLKCINEQGQEITSCHLSDHCSNAGGNHCSNHISGGHLSSG